MNEDVATHPDRAIVRDDIGRKFCDVVLKGGITSGVVYPKAIARLAKQYRFRNIGGTSAGAIAAAGAAAAEYRRANAHPAERPAGFDKLAELPDFFARRPEGSAHSNLFHLFKPEKRTRRHFAILASVLNREGPGGRVLRGVLESMWQFKAFTALGIAPGAFLAASIELSTFRGVVALLVCIAFAIFGGAIAAVVATASSLLRVLPSQDFGLSSGFDPAQHSGQPPALINWLYPFLQDVAGKPVRDPLTFGDLDNVTLDSGVKGIVLRMMTTALSMGRPLTLPFRLGRFYFKEGEMARYFPAEVVAWMVGNPGPATDEKRDSAMSEMGFHAFPGEETLPVIVATRMSLAFPFLLSAIPLYRHAWEDEKAAADDSAKERRRVRRVLFSDGGICSNFPLHMFDSVLPAWPTFGFNLRDDLPKESPVGDRAYLPDLGKSLPPESYRIGDRQDPGPVPSFAIAIIKTMQNWRDNLQRAAPGFRDRVVTIRHTAEEGGLNLDMESEALREMAASGQLAAETLVRAFGEPPSIEEDHLTRHRWVRVRSLLAVLQGELREVHEGITELDNHPTFPELIDNSEAYVGRSYPLRRASRIEAQKILDALSSLHDSLQQPRISFEDSAPRPEVAMRIQPVI